MAASRSDGVIATDSFVVICAGENCQSADKLSDNSNSGMSISYIPGMCSILHAVILGFINLQSNNLYRWRCCWCYSHFASHHLYHWSIVLVGCTMFRCLARLWN